MLGLADLGHGLGQHQFLAVLIEESEQASEGLHVRRPARHTAIHPTLLHPFEVREAHHARREPIHHDGPVRSDSATRVQSLYPFMFLLPNGKAYEAGTNNSTAILNVTGPPLSHFAMSIGE